ncbi:MAG: nuclear transport factor 2 family protein [Candidatus Eremiobacteraeota bacterium]|nr:nuclear transport factor 2 family protein [Candidatus Eremiobacteraeota bacterium]
MHTNAQAIERFYEAFGRRAHAEMVTSYHQEVAFSDPVFPDLVGWRAAAMWRMLCERGTDLTIEASEISANDERGQALWEAHYTFSQTGRKVHNKIQANFRFRDGLIVEHKDSFDLHRWAGQAIGLPGKLLGWAAFFRAKVQANAGQSLEKFIQKHNLSETDFWPQ